MPTSPRVAAVAEHGRARRSRERRALRALAVPLFLLVVVPALTTRPRPSLHGAGLAVSLGIAGFAAAFAAVQVQIRRTQDGDTRGWPLAVALASMALGGVVMIAAQPQGTAAFVLGLVGYVAGARLSLRLGLGLLGSAGVAVVVALAARDPRPAIAIGTTLLLAALLFVVARLYTRARLDRERAELVSAELEDARERELEAVALAERGRIARDLHDVLAHSLSGLSIQLEGARLLAESEGSSEALRDVLVRSRRLAADGLGEARRALGVLRGGAVPGAADLPALIEGLNGSGVDVEFRVTGASRLLTAETGIALYRAAQEALTNVVRHSGARAAEVELEYTASAVRLIVTDAGGADHPRLASAGSGYGLSAMRDRTESLGGRMSAGPAGQGFEVNVELPA